MPSDLTTLRIRCAERMGWKAKQTDDNVAWWIVSPGIRFHYSGCGRTLEEAWCEYIPHYDTDRNALHELVLAVPEEKRVNFVDELGKELLCNCWERTYGAIWLLLTAPPEAIMKAFLEVMDDKIKKQKEEK